MIPKSESRLSDKTMLKQKHRCFDGSLDGFGKAGSA
jgi:hypothetical protein